MAGPPSGPGIADDAADYQDFPEGEDRPAAQAPPGQAKVEGDDPALYADLVAPAPTDDPLTLDASWLYKSSGQIFGPVSSKALLDKLYGGEIDAESPIAPEDGEFMALRRYGAFALHLPKVVDHRAAAMEAARRESEVKSKQIRRWAIVAVAVVVTLGGGGWFVWTSVANARVEKAAREKREKEDKLKHELENLLANLTIEPPLVDLVDEEPPEEPIKPGQKRRKGAKKSAPRPGSDLPPTVPIQRSEVVAGVNEVFGGLKQCIIEQITRDPESVSDVIRLSFAVNNAGAVQDFDIDDRNMKKLPIKDCMGAKLGQLRFRKYIGEVQNIEYPITIGGRR